MKGEMSLNDHENNVECNGDCISKGFWKKKLIASPFYFFWRRIFYAIIFFYLALCYILFGRYQLLESNDYVG